MPFFSTTTCKTSGFNYCKWAKILVAIPAFPLIALSAASFFTTTPCRVVAGLGAVVLAYALAVWLDRVPLLMRKVRNVADGIE